jgi:sugar phosphate permease
MELPEAPDRERGNVFLASWASYFSYYVTRKPVAATKAPLKAELGLSSGQLAWIDFVYNVAYCVGQVTNGFLADRIGPRRLVAMGMLLSAAMCVAFSLVHTMTGWLVGTYMLIWGINGFAQSTGWPGNAKAMSSWYGTAGRGRVMGWWSTCYQAGGLAATLIAAALLEHFGWRGVYLGSAIWVSVVAVAFYLIVRDRPHDKGYRDPDTTTMSKEERRAALRAEWPRVLRTPMVWAMGAAYFCCKLIRYAFLFWLPLYLYEVHDYTQTASLTISLAFEGGGILLVIAAGYLADHVFHRRRVFTAFLFLIGLVASLQLYSVAGGAVGANVIGLMLVGGTLFAADSLISGAVAQDLGGPHAAALAAGLINGIGSIGQVMQGFLLVWISGSYGWTTLFSLFSVLAGVAALCLVPFLRVGPKEA